MNYNTSAQRTTVQIGQIQTDGYLLPEHLRSEQVQYALSKTQLILLAYPDHPRRYAAGKFNDIVALPGTKAMVPQGFTVYKRVRTNRVRNDAVFVDLIPCNEVPLFLQVCRVSSKAGKAKCVPTERRYRDKLHEELGGEKEVVTLSGKIDLLTPHELIEVKDIRHWKEALGQVLAYGHFYPSHCKRIHLFGATQTAFLQMIKDIVSPYGIAVTWEP
jgi:hypothetical protein